MIEAIGGRYVTTHETSILEGAQGFGPFDLIFEATGFSPVAFESMRALAKNSVLVLSSVTGGDRKIQHRVIRRVLDNIEGHVAEVPL